jgi:2-iminobutanoate/2-iminopropanoate deaminase
LEKGHHDRQAVSTEHAPPAIGPDSQAIIANGLVFCSGTAGIDPVTRAVAVGIEAQTEQALRNLQAILTAAGTSMGNLVKTTIFYANVEDFTTINQVYAQHLPDPHQPDPLRRTSCCPAAYSSPSTSSPRPARHHPGRGDARQRAEPHRRAPPLMRSEPAGEGAGHRSVAGRAVA